jgi:glycosyltransferase involved in cell wall biosynthesis
MEPVDVSLVIACYNEGPFLQDSVRQVIEILDVTCWRYELIFIDDCSRDSTPDTIRLVEKQYPDHRLRTFFHPQNVGRGGTVNEGIRRAQGAVVGFIDIDLEVSANYIPAFVSAVMGGADMAIADRGYRIALHILHRWILSRGYSRLSRALLGLPYRDTEAGYKFFNRQRILPVLDRTQNVGWFWDTEIVARAHMAGLQIREIPVLFLKRREKKSTVRLIPDMWDYWVALSRFRAQVRQKSEP